MKKHFKISVLIAFVLFGFTILPGSFVALAAPAAPVTQTTHPGTVRIHTPQELKAAMNVRDRLYVIGDPGDLAEYAKLTARNPHVVIILIESSADWQSDRVVIGKELQNSELLRRVLTDPLTGLPDGIGVMRVNRKENGKGMTEFHAAQRLVDLGFSRDALNNRFAELKHKGYTIPEAIGQVATEAQKAVANAQQDAKGTVARQLDQARQKVAELKSMMASSGFRPAGLSDEVISGWIAKLDQGDAAFKKGDLQSSQAAAQLVNGEVQRFSTEVRAVIIQKEHRDLAIKISALLAIFLAGSSVAVTAVIRRKAIEEVRSLADDADQDVTKAMEILSVSTYVGINSTGRQKEETERLAALSNSLLEQAVIYEKYMDRADDVLNAKGLGWLIHHVLPFGVIYVKKLATGKTSLKVTNEDIRTLIAGSVSLNKDYNPGSTTINKDLTVGDVKALFAETHPVVQELLERLEQAESNLQKGIGELEGELGKLLEDCQSLSTLSVQGLFSEKPVAESLVPSVQHESSGHISLARRCLDQNDALGGIENHTEPGKRIVSDGVEAVVVSKYGCEHVVPAMTTTITALSAPPAAISTEWCEKFALNASDALGRIIRVAPLQSIQLELEQTLTELQSLKALYEEAVRLNSLRVDNWPVEYESKLNAILTSQAVILSGLQQLGFFKDGSVEGLYMEAGLSPKEELSKFEVALREMADALGAGNVQRGKHIEQVISASQKKISELISGSENVVAQYAVTSGDLKTAADNAAVKAQTQAPFVRNASQAYSDFSQERALGESGFGAGASILTRAYEEAGELIAASQESLAAADRLMDHGAVLQAAQRNSAADNNLKEATGIQDVIDLAITTLADKVAAVTVELNAAIELRNSAVPSANQSGVRSTTRNLVKALGDELISCAGALASEPYEVHERLTGIGRRIEEAMAMIEEDLNLLASIDSTMANAALYVTRANAAIANAQHVSFTYSTVDLSRASSALSNYDAAGAEIALLVAAESYEGALSVANEANSSIQLVAGLVSEAISVAEQQNQAEIDRLAQIEADRLQAIEDEKERARQAEIDAQVPFAATEDANSNSIDFSGTED